MSDKSKQENQKQQPKRQPREPTSHVHLEGQGMIETDNNNNQENQRLQTVNNELNDKVEKLEQCIKNLISDNKIEQTILALERAIQQVKEEKDEKTQAIKKIKEEQDLEIEKSKQVARKDIPLKMRLFLLSKDQEIKQVNDEMTTTHQKAKAEMVTFESSLINNKGAIFRPKSEKEKTQAIKQVKDEKDEKDRAIKQVNDEKDRAIKGLNEKVTQSEKEKTQAIKQFKDEQIESIRQLGDLCKSDLLSSKSNFKQAKDLMKLCEFNSKTTKLQLKYRGTRDGFDGQTFHRLCDTIGPSLTIVKARKSGNVFGGYTEVSWAGDSVAKADDNAFIYSLINQETRPLKIKVTPGDGDAIGCLNGYGPIFGHDLAISNNSNTTDRSYSYLSHTYKHPDYQHGSTKAENFLAGSNYFLTEEVEVYQVNRI